jgi:hypothetical protein
MRKQIWRRRRRSAAPVSEARRGRVLRRAAAARVCGASRACSDHAELYIAWRVRGATLTHCAKTRALVRRSICFFETTTPFLRQNAPLPTRAATCAPPTRRLRLPLLPRSAMSDPERVGACAAAAPGGRCRRPKRVAAAAGRSSALPRRGASSLLARHGLARGRAAARSNSSVAAVTRCCCVLAHNTWCPVAARCCRPAGAAPPAQGLLLAPLAGEGCAVLPWHVGLALQRH